MLTFRYNDLSFLVSFGADHGGAKTRTVRSRWRVASPNLQVLAPTYPARPSLCLNAVSTKLDVIPDLALGWFCAGWVWLDPLVTQHRPTEEKEEKNDAIFTNGRFKKSISTVKGRH